MKKKNTKGTDSKSCSCSNSTEEEILFKVLGTVFDSISKTVGPECEVSLHDLRKPSNHTIIKITNGYITGRSVGGPLARLGVNFLKSKNIEDLQLDRIHLTNGKMIKAYISLFYNKQQEPIAMLAILVDITDIVKYSNSVQKMFGISQHSMQIEETSLFLNDALNRISYLADNIINQNGKSIAEMNKEDRLEIIKQFHNSGFFKVKGGMKVISEKLGVSKYTIYSYLNIINDG